jgi:hypothetical protein
LFERNNSEKLIGPNPTERYKGETEKIVRALARYGRPPIIHYSDSCIKYLQLPSSEVNRTSSPEKILADFAELVGVNNFQVVENFFNLDGQTPIEVTEECSTHVLIALNSFMEGSRIFAGDPDTQQTIIQKLGEFNINEAGAITIN